MERWQWQGGAVETSPRERPFQKGGDYSELDLLDPP